MCLGNFILFFPPVVELDYVLLLYKDVSPSFASKPLIAVFFIRFPFLINTCNIMLPSSQDYNTFACSGMQSPPSKPPTTVISERSFPPFFVFLVAHSNNVCATRSRSSSRVQIVEKFKTSKLVPFLNNVHLPNQPCGRVASRRFYPPRQRRTGIASVRVANCGTCYYSCLLHLYNHNTTHTHTTATTCLRVSRTF